MQNESRRLILLDITIMLLSLGVFYFLLLGQRSLFVPDEGRYAEIALEMLKGGDYITPHLNGIKYFEKPALFYWLSTIAMHIGGVNLWALRTVNAIIAICGLMATYLATYQLYDRKTALLATGILATSTLYFVMAHVINLDLSVSVFLSICLFGIILGAQQSTNLHYFLIASLFSAMAVLTKGLIGIVLPGMVFCAWLFWTRKWQVLLGINYIATILVFLIITVPWHYKVGAKNPEFYYFYFIEQHFLRYTTESVGHPQPFWYFIPALIIGFFPWSFFLPQALTRRSPNHADKFFIVWAISIFVFFSFSKSKLISYILPIFPALAVLSARYFTTVNADKGMKLGLCALSIFTGFFAVVIFMFIRQGNFPDSFNASLFLTLAALTMLLGSAIVTYLGWQRDIDRAFKSLIITSVCFLLLLLAAWPAIDTRTIRPLAVYLKTIKKPQDEVITYNQYYQDLPFYLEHTVSILNWQNELTFGLQHQPSARAWMINEQDFWQKWHSSKRIFVMLSIENLNQWEKTLPSEHFYLLKTSINNVLISNQS